ncbi:MAG: hypothetical protein KJN92_16415, partial [Gemmatimonadetes bacterium]|nr:hypothetical protein [Gemmatimonadota bacterium]
RKRRYLQQWNPMPTPKETLAKAGRRGRGGDALRRWKAIRVEDLHELNREEVERLLEKAKDQGAEALTSEERAMLDRFSAPH